MFFIVLAFARLFHKIPAVYMNNIFITLENGKIIEQPAGCSVESLINPGTVDPQLPFLGALVNNNVSSLSYKLQTNCSIKFATMADPHGWRIYRNSLCFLLAKVIKELYPSAHFCIEHSFGLGLYCTFHNDKNEDTGITKEQLQIIELRMCQLVQENIPIERQKISFADAVKQFERSGQTDKLNILKYRNPPHVVIYCCGSFSDLAHGPLATRTGLLQRFQLIHYPPGFVLHLPDRTNPLVIPPFVDQQHLFQIFKEHKEWGRVLGVTTAGALNETIMAGKIDSFIRTAEALHEKKLTQIADQIAVNGKSTGVILIAGPSSSGKTTMAKRLATHLEVNGLRPVTLSTDNYFVGADKNPRDENGNPDYEHLEAVDLPLLNEHLSMLIKGKQIEMPRFNFETKEREYRGDVMKIDKDQIIIIEGIHSLNPRLTESIPQDRKFRIYVSALTQLNVDANNRISTTDNRLMRRLVRDYKFRGHSPLYTLQLWPSVRAGEKKWIFPFQQEADATFNSALDYELAVLKPLVEPLLMQVKPTDPEYAEARRLSEFLLNFLIVPDHHVPSNSILREYIGGSSFDY